MFESSAKCDSTQGFSEVLRHQRGLRFAIAALLRGEILDVHPGYTCDGDTSRDEKFKLDGPK